jgi:protein-disulfide isomerase/uncharacterized membrane protein
MTARSRVLLLVFTLLGVVATSWSTWVHYQLLRSPTVTSVCDISETLNCTDAYRSAYGTLAGVPVALLGACFFVLLLLLQAGARAGTPASANVASYAFALSVPGLLFAAYLAHASWFVLHVVCVLCLSTYVAVAGVFLVAGFSTRFSMTTLSDRFLRDLRVFKTRPAAIAVAALFVVGTAGLLRFFPKEPDFSGPIVPPEAVPSPSSELVPASGQQADTVQAQLQQYLDTQPRRVIPVDAAGAQVIVVKFNDYQCPPCKQTFELYKPIKQKWELQAPGRVRFVTKDFPLEPECNTNVPKGVHALACEAAAAVRMARRNNKAEPLEDWIFANQGSLTLDGLKKAVRDIGGVPDFEGQFPRVLNDVKVDTSLGGFLGVHSTPTFFINGVQIPSLQPQLLDAAIAYELKKASGGK